MRQLVTIEKIAALYPIPNADFIETAQVLGWSLIVKKGEFKVGDRCVFFEIDSFLPAEPKYSFLGTPKEHLGRLGYRIKTMKMRGVISQGLALPLALFGMSSTDAKIFEKDPEYLQTSLNVIKYDVDLVKSIQGSSPQTGDQSGAFPSFIPKTDEERIQNLPHYFEQYKNMMWEETLKLNGSSCTMFKVEGEFKWYQKILSKLGFTIIVEPHFGVCSRNMALKDNSDIPKGQQKKSNFWDAVRKYGIQEALPVGYALQGELIAPNIQSNHEKVADVEFHVFNIYDIKAKRYLTSDEKAWVKTFLGKAPHIKIVNKKIQIFKECPTLPELLARVDSESINPGTVSEGRVYKSLSVNGLSFKVINNKYLIKCEN